MNLKRKIFLALFSIVAISSAIFYSACNKNKCHNVICFNEGVCDGGKCVCPVGFEGSNCQTLSRDKFLFTYNGRSLCGPNDSAHQYSVHLLAVLHDSLEMVMTNFLDNMNDSAICTIRSVDSFTFIGSNNSTTFTGVGKLNNDSLFLSYHVVQDTTSYDCTYLGQSLR